MINKIDHIGIAVTSIDEVLPFYLNILQFELMTIEVVSSQKVRVAFIKIGEITLELLEPTSDDSVIAKFITKRGQGIHHLALGVESIEDRILDMKTKGINMIDEHSKIGAGGAHIAFMHPNSTNGVLFELCEKGGLS